MSVEDGACGCAVFLVAEKFMQLSAFGFIFGTVFIEYVGQPGGTPASPAGQGALFFGSGFSVFCLELAVRA